MLDWFTIFTKGGIVLWYFQGTALSLTPAVNSLIRSIILQERGGVNSYNHGNLTLQFKMDNELEIIYVVVYQNILKLAYIDKLLDQVHLKFRDRYKNEVVGGAFAVQMDFSHDFNWLLRKVEEEQKQLSKPEMKTFEESHKAKKVMSSTTGKSKGTKAGKASTTTTTGMTAKVEETKEEEEEEEEEEDVEEGGGGEEEGEEDIPQAENVGPTSSAMSAVMKKGLVARGAGRGRGGVKTKKSGVKSSPKPGGGGGGKKKKEPTRWAGGAVSSTEAEALNYSNPPPSSSSSSTSSSGPGSTNGDIDRSMVGRMRGELKQLDTNDPNNSTTTTTTTETKKNKSGGGGGMFSFFKNLTGGKTITREAMDPSLEKMKEHLVTKNVALEIADKLCGSVATKLDGKVIGTFTGIQSLVKTSMEESLVQILSPKRRVDILRDVMSSKERGQPYVITFCGVNGVGKSTNLAKVCFWLMENGLRVLIAGCDTFRAGAVEQLRTHTKHLNSLHPPQDGLPPKVMLYERGYDKDAANIAMEAIQYARQQSFDVVLVDTAGRMQNNEPLMRALAKLIRVNSPDLVLFVGEALVGNEAVDQLIHFNQALVDHSEDGNHRTIDGILLTKFDTVDDKVGAAISMTYTTGQPIVFVGTGQTYTDLRSLNVQAVISVLLK